MNLVDPRSARVFRFVRADWLDASGTAELVYAFDDGPELIEHVRFPNAPALPAERADAFAKALSLLHLIAGVSYYKAGVPEEIVVEAGALDDATAALLDLIYTEGLGEFAYQNKLELSVRFPRAKAAPELRRLEGSLLARRTLVPVGGGKDSLVTLELLRAAKEPITAAWVGNSALIADCVAASGADALNISRELSPLLFELNRLGAYNGHIPVTAINSAILVVAAILYGYDAIAFSNERSASSETLIDAKGRAVNHQWSKGWAFERAFGEHVSARIAKDLHYFSMLRPLSELAVTRLFAPLTQYHAVFSSCNRNFKILGARPESRWCGVCPKCLFVFLALAPFVPKPRLTTIFGRNLLDDASLERGFDALMEWDAHKPFECVGEAREARAAMAVLSDRAEWREDAVVARFREEILPKLHGDDLALDPLLVANGEHRVPERLARVFDAIR